MAQVQTDESTSPCRTKSLEIADSSLEKLVYDGRQLFLSMVVGSFMLIEAHQHLFCTTASDVFTGVDVMGSCAFLAPVHTFTEMLCKYAIVVFVVKALSGFCGLVSAQRVRCSSRAMLLTALCVLPAVGYVFWPRAFRSFFGEEGSCGKPCQYTEELVEYFCCIDVLMEMSGALYDFVILLSAGGNGVCQHCWVSSLHLDDDIEDQFFRGTTPECHQGQQDHVTQAASSTSMRAFAKRVAVFVGLGLYLLVVALLAESTLGGWKDDEQTIVFRVVDAALQAGHVFRLMLALRMLVHWLELCRGSRLGARGGLLVCDPPKVAALMEVASEQALRAAQLIRRSPDQFMRQISPSF